jgi:hypothetical protein
MTTVILLAAGAILTVGVGALALCAAAAHADREMEDEPWKGRTMTPTKCGYLAPTTFQQRPLQPHAQIHTASDDQPASDQLQRASSTLCSLTRCGKINTAS